jgi:TonB family protein
VAGPKPPREAFKAEISSHSPEFKACLRKEGKKKDRTPGEAMFALRIAPDGRVYSARIKQSSFTNSAVQECLLSVWRKMRFPAPSGSEGATVLYPLKFTP